MMMTMMIFIVVVVDIILTPLACVLDSSLEAIFEVRPH